MRPLSVVVPYYRNPVMLDRQLTVWAHEWPDLIKRQVEIVIVDDASPESAWAVFQSRALGCDLSFQIVRVKHDRPWHQHGARNLGAHVATGRWLLMTDMDHVIPAAAIRAALSVPRDDLSYFFRRVDAPAGRWSSTDCDLMAPTLDREGNPKPHVNSFLVTRKRYWMAGGYDEDYCGVYGTDSLFRKRLLDVAPRLTLDVPLIRVAREVIADASTVGLLRKEGRPTGAKKAVARAKKKRGESDVIKTLQFEWERIL